MTEIVEPRPTGRGFPANTLGCMAKKVITIRLPDETVTAIDAVRGGVPRARWVEDVITDALEPGRDEPIGAAAVTPRTGTARSASCDHPRARVLKNFCYKCGSMVVK